MHRRKQTSGRQSTPDLGAAGPAAQQPHHEDSGRASEVQRGSDLSQSARSAGIVQTTNAQARVPLARGNSKLQVLLKERWCQEAVLEPRLLPSACHPVPKGIPLWAQSFLGEVGHHSPR